MDFLANTSSIGVVICKYSGTSVTMETSRESFPHRGIPTKAASKKSFVRRVDLRLTRG
jgi:hypothetical protein